jgi:streptogramin lyase
MGTWTLRLVLAALVVLSPAAARPEAAEELSIRLAGQPLELVGTPDALWVLTCVRRCSGEARRSTGRIVRIDPRDGRVLASVPLSRPHAIAVGSSGVYALDFWRDTVHRLDPQTLRTTASLRLVLPYEIAPGDDAFLPFDIAVGRNAVWVSTARGALARVDLGVSRVAAMLRLPVKGGEIAVGDGAVWLAQGLRGVYRVDPRTNRVSARIRIGPATGRLAVDRPLMGGGNVLAIDPNRNRPEAVTPLASGPLAVAFGKGSLWSARVGGSSVERIEAGTGKVIGRFSTDDVSALAVAGGHVWTATRGTIRRLAAP